MQSDRPSSIVSCSGPPPALGAALLGLHACGVVSCLYAPRTGGAYDSDHRTAGIAGRTRRRGGGVAGGGTRAQQPAMPLVGFLFAGAPTTLQAQLAGFRRGLAESGYVEGQNVAVE